MSTVFSVNDATVIRNDRYLVQNVTFECENASVIALIGPNGAGKSTLLSLLAGDLTPDQGDVQLLGKSITHYKPRELAQIRAVLPQQTILQFSYRANEVVAMGRVPLPPVSHEEENEAIDDALSSTETLHLRDRIYTQLSGGEQNRVSLARVLAQKTPVILLDEPTAALDVRHQHRVMHVAGELAETGATVIAVVHDLNLAFAYATRIGVMHQGHLVAFDTPWGIAKANLLSEIFDFPLHVLRHPAIPHPLVVPLNCELPTSPGSADAAPLPYVITLDGLP